MATSPAGKKPAPRKTLALKPAATAKKRAGIVAPVKKAELSNSAPNAPAKLKKAPARTVVKRAAASQPAPEIESDSTTSLPQLGLTAKQQRFVNEYQVDLNATQAAIRAGYSADTAGAIGHENLKKPEIQLALLNARKAQQERTNITADGVLREAWNAQAKELGLIASLASTSGSYREAPDPVCY